MGFVLEYEYVMDVNYIGDVAVSNEVSLNGDWSSNNNIKLNEVSSSATVNKKLIKIYKVDGENFKKTLPGTEFRLEYYDKVNKIWKVKKENIRVEIGRASCRERV